MQTYRVTVSGRKNGAIGVCYVLGTLDVVARDKDEAAQQARDTFYYRGFEHLSTVARQIEES